MSNIIARYNDEFQHLGPCAMKHFLHHNLSTCATNKELSITTTSKVTTLNQLYWYKITEQAIGSNSKRGEEDGRE